MAQAAAMLVGLTALWFMLSPRMENPAALAIGAAAAACAGAGGLWLAGRAPAPRITRRLSFARAFSALRGGVRVVWAVIAPAGLAPAFVKIKSRAAATHDRALEVEAIADGAGAVVVEIEADGFLLHALDEEAIDTRSLGGLGGDRANGDDAA